MRPGRLPGRGRRPILRGPSRRRTAAEALLGRVALVFSAGVLGISFAAIFVRLALPAPPVIAGFYRMLFATALLLAWVGLTRRRVALGARGGLLALGAGLCFGTDLALWNTSLVRTSVATSTLLVNTTPIHVGLFSLLVWRQALDRRFVAGAALALAGCAVLLGRPSHAHESLEGALLALAAALFYAGYLLLMKAAREGVDTLSALLAASGGATAALGLYGALGGGPFSGFPASSWAAIGGMAVVSQVGGVMGIVWALRYLPATVASVGLLAQPVAAAVWGWWLLGEPVAPLQALGGVAVLAGIALASRAAEAPGATAA